MKVALIQAPLIWEDPFLNRNYFEEKINDINQSIDLVVLPEMFTTGFTMNPSLVAETMNGKTILWMQNLADSKNMAITGSLIIKENNNYYNRLIFVFPSGEIKYYDKKHLFTLAGEDKFYTSGKTKTTINYKGLNICPHICYDLRFPVFSRNTNNYDVLIYVANWPKPRTNAWDILLKARSIENMCYTIGVNRIGTDNNSLEYIGHSQLIDCLGNTIIDAQELEGVFISTIDKGLINETRAKFGFLNDRDQFTLLD